MTQRFATSIVEVTGMESGGVSTEELWGLNDRNELVPRGALQASSREVLRRWGWEWEVDGWAHRLEGQR